MNSKIIINAFYVLMFSLFISCGNNNTDSTKTQTDSSSKTKENSETTPTTTNTSTVEDGPAIATVKTPNYVAKIHKAIVFKPKDDVGGNMFTVKEGHEMVVLDMSIKNTSGKELEMGQVLLAAQVTDESGKKYDLNLGSVAAYTYSYPNPAHQPQYDGLWGKMMPGDFFRAAAYGLQIPQGTKSLTISLLEEGNVFSDKIPRYEMKFTID